MSEINQGLWTLESLKSKVGKDGRPFHIFLDNPTMRAELYEIPVGVTDLQSPHDWDELYYIISGRANFTADGVTHAVKKGDTLFVKALIPHRFHDIKEDLSILVFFSKEEPRT